MVNQQILDYIKQQLQQGINNEQIKQALITNGWQSADIEDAFSSINYSVQGQPILNSSNKAPIRVWKIIVASLAGVIIVGSGIYFASQKLFKSEQSPNTKQTSEEVVSPMPTKETPTGITAMDCKQDFDCFIQASQNCKLAKVDYTTTTDIFGVKQTTKSFFEIKGAEATKCIFFLRTEKIDLAFPASVPPEIVSQQKEIYKKLEGRSGSCQFNTSDLTAMLSKWKQGNFSTEDFKAAECSGTYFEQLAQEEIYGKRIPANTSTKIELFQCPDEAERLSAQEDGTACFENQKDLGSIRGITVNEKPVQCCVPK